MKNLKTKIFTVILAVMVAVSMISFCGAQVNAKSCKHTWVNTGKATNYGNATYHKQTLKCKKCGKTTTKKVKHSFAWQYKDKNKHKQVCRSCSYKTGKTAKHKKTWNVSFQCYECKSCNHLFK